jgi:hypothetical protein
LVLLKAIVSFCFALRALDSGVRRNDACGWVRRQYQLRHTGESRYPDCAGTRDIKRLIYHVR